MLIFLVFGIVDHTTSTTWVIFSYAYSQVRSNIKKAKQSKYSAHFDAKAQHKVKVGDSVIPKNAIDAAFEEFSDENMDT